MDRVSLSPENLNRAAQEAEDLARRLPNATFCAAAERMRRRAHAVSQGATVDELAIAGDPLALFCLRKGAA